MNLQRFSRSHATNAAGYKRSTPSAQESSNGTGNWESFVGLWDRANLIRGYLWNHGTTGNKNLLTQVLVRLRRFFGADFAFGSVTLDGERIVEAGVPEATIEALPPNFSRRYRDLVVNSRAPITWNDLSSQFKFRSAVVAPLAPPLGRPLGFLMLAHASRRSYSSAELFLIQALAGELTWALHDLTCKQQHQIELEGLAHDIKNALQVTIGNAALIRQKLAGGFAADQERHIANIESSVQEISGRLSCVARSSIAEEEEGDAGNEAAVDIAAEVTEAIESCRETLNERGGRFEVIFTPQCPGQVRIEPLSFKRFLCGFLSAAARRMRDETAKLVVQRDRSSLEFAVVETSRYRVAEKLRSLFEPAARTDAMQGKPGNEVELLKEYLEQTGGDVYLRSRLGEASEFVVRLPVHDFDSAARRGQ